MSSVVIANDYHVISMDAYEVKLEFISKQRGKINNRKENGKTNKTKTCPMLYYSAFVRGILSVVKIWRNNTWPPPMTPSRYTPRYLPRRHGVQRMLHTTSYARNVRHAGTPRLHISAHSNSYQSFPFSFGSMIPNFSQGHM